MVKFDVGIFRFLNKDDFRVLTAIEMGMKNHESVPVQLIESISGLKRFTKRCISNVHKFKLVFHDAKIYDGYRLTYLGYDYLALRAMLNRGTLTAVGRQIGVGKESDVFDCVNDKGEIMVLKLHRLGRISFRAVVNKRDYLKHRHSASWLYLSRLAAEKEFNFMRNLKDSGFAVPRAIDHNRHCIIMQYIPGTLLASVRILKDPKTLLDSLIENIVKLAEMGLVHSDYNEFNILINKHEKPTFIDFPQMVSTSNPNAELYFDRDVGCVALFFEKIFEVGLAETPDFKKITGITNHNVTDITNDSVTEINLISDDITNDSVTEINLISDDITNDNVTDITNVTDKYKKSVSQINSLIHQINEESF